MELAYVWEQISFSFFEWITCNFRVLFIDTTVINELLNNFSTRQARSGTENDNIGQLIVTNILLKNLLHPGFSPIYPSICSANRSCTHRHGQLPNSCNPD
jgi:hypothetical protein